MLGADARIAFADLYTLDLQAAFSRTRADGSARTAPLWQASLNRNGRSFGFRYQVRGIDEDFGDAAGFIRRLGIADVNVDHRWTIYGRQGSLLESFTTDVVLDGTWLYSGFVAGREPQDRKLHFNNNFRLRGGWRVRGIGALRVFRVRRAALRRLRSGAGRTGGSCDPLPDTEARWRGRTRSDGRGWRARATASSSR